MLNEIKNKERFYALDVFRGATVALMILVNNPGSWAHIYTPLAHAQWHGVTPTDLVFPFFLFVVGNAFAFVMPHLREAGPSLFWKKIIKRSLIIFLIGVFMRWYPFVRYEGDHLVFTPWSYAGADGELYGIRIMGILQRIAIAYFFAAVIIHYFKVRGSFLAACLILLFYWFLCVIMNPIDPYSIHGWFGTDIDKYILSEHHLSHGSLREGNKPLAFDPEGLVSSFGPIAQVIFGYLCGFYIIKNGKTQEMVNGLFAGGAILMFAGYAWSLTFPINKRIWTSSYVVLTTGLAMTIIALMIYLIDLKNKRGWLDKFFIAFGKNPLFIFILSAFIPRTTNLIRIPNGVAEDGSKIFTTPLRWFYEYICKPVFPHNLKAGSLLYAIVWIIFMWLIAHWMDKKKIYIKV
jgi:predicted acyltransferase